MRKCCTGCYGEEKIENKEQRNEQSGWMMIDSELLVGECNGEEMIDRVKTERWKVRKTERDVTKEFSLIEM